MCQAGRTPHRHPRYHHPRHHAPRLPVSLWSLCPSPTAHAAHQPADASTNYMGVFYLLLTNTPPEILPSIDRKRIAVTTYSTWISFDNNLTSLLGRVGNTNKCYIRKHQHTWLHPEDKHRSNTRDACEKHKGTFFWPRYIYSYVLSDVRRLALFLRPLKTSHYCLVHWHYNLDKTPLFSRAIHENKDSRRYIWVHLSLFSRLPLKGSQRPIPRGSSKTPQNKQCVARPFTAHT